MTSQSQNGPAAGTAEYAAQRLTGHGLSCPHHPKYSVNDAQNSKYPSRIGLFHQSSDVIGYLVTTDLCVSCCEAILPDGFNAWSLFSKLSQANQGTKPTRRWLAPPPAASTMKPEDYYPTMIQCGSDLQTASISQSPQLIIPPGHLEAKRAWQWLQQQRKPFYIDHLHVTGGWRPAAERNANLDSLIAEKYGIQFAAEQNVEPKTEAPTCTKSPGTSGSKTGAVARKSKPHAVLPKANPKPVGGTPVVSGVTGALPQKEQTSGVQAQGQKSISANPIVPSPSTVSQKIVQATKQPPQPPEPALLKSIVGVQTGQAIKWCDYQPSSSLDGQLSMLPGLVGNRRGTQTSSPQSSRKTWDEVTKKLDLSANDLKRLQSSPEGDTRQSILKGMGDINHGADIVTKLLESLRPQPSEPNRKASDKKVATGSKKSRTELDEENKKEVKVKLKPSAVGSREVPSLASKPRGNPQPTREASHEYPGKSEKPMLPTPKPTIPIMSQPKPPYFQPPQPTAAAPHLPTPPSIKTERNPKPPKVKVPKVRTGNMAPRLPSLGNLFSGHGSKPTHPTHTTSFSSHTAMQRKQPPTHIEDHHEYHTNAVSPPQSENKPTVVVLQQAPTHEASAPTTPSKDTSSSASDNETQHQIEVDSHSDSGPDQVDKVSSEYTEDDDDTSNEDASTYENGKPESSVGSGPENGPDDQSSSSSDGDPEGSAAGSEADPGEFGFGPDGSSDEGLGNDEGSQSESQGGPSDDDDNEAENPDSDEEEGVSNDDDDKDDSSDNSDDNHNEDDDDDNNGEDEDPYSDDNDAYGDNNTSSGDNDNQFGDYDDPPEDYDNTEDGYTWRDEH